MSGTSWEGLYHTTMKPPVNRLLIRMPDALSQAVAALAQGDLVIFPTDTVYGLGAHAFLPQAVAYIYAAKARPAHMPIPLLLPGIEMLPEVCTNIPTVAWEIAKRFWPGGLSLVLYRSKAVPDAVTAGGDTVAVRVPDHSLVRQLCKRLGAPLAATSANQHDKSPAATADEAEAALASLMRNMATTGGRISLLLDGGPCPGGIASTLLDLTVTPPVILRSGPITANDLGFVLTPQSRTPDRS